MLSVDNLVARVATVILIGPFVIPLVASILLIVSRQAETTLAITIAGVPLIRTLIAASPTIDDEISSICPIVLIISAIKPLIPCIELVVTVKGKMKAAIAIPMKVLIMRQPAMWMPASNSGWQCVRRRRMVG